MRLVLDIETNSLKNPKHIWLVVCKDIDTQAISVFKNLTEDLQEKERFLVYIKDASLVIGHNILGFDIPILSNLLGYVPTEVVDTLIISKLVNYSRPGGHSLEQYGVEHGLEKIKFNDWTHLSEDMVTYCIRDVNINHLVYDHYRSIISDPAWTQSIRLEHDFQYIVNSLHNNGFYFDTKKSKTLLEKVLKELEELDAKIKDAFPAKSRLVREIHPRLTQHGTLHKGDFRFVKGNDLSEYNGGPFSRFTWEVFNPASHKQVIDVLHQAGWAPTEVTTTHQGVLRELGRLKYRKGRQEDIDTRLKELYNSLTKLERYGYKINEANLSTLPEKAPTPARTLARRILVESRRRTLVEWLGLVQDDSRIHGKFIGIGAWTHRMAHQQPNTANIPTDGKLYGAEMRSLWRAPRNRLLVGVDAEGIQLRIFAHYVNNKELTESLVNGNKISKTDPHSLNQRILGSVCGSRQIAKRFVYALFLGAGLGKLANILECGKRDAEEALNRILERYPGFARLRREVIPSDAKHGYFIGLDGRRVLLPGDTEGDRRHLAMSGYLQNGEAIIMKMACLLWMKELANEDFKIVNFVHDEWQTETPNDMEKALRVAETQRSSLEKVGEILRLNCPLAGSYWNEDRKDYTIGPNWNVTH